MLIHVNQREDEMVTGLVSPYFFSGSWVKTGNGDRREGFEGVNFFVCPNSDMSLASLQQDGGGGSVLDLMRDDRWR